METSVETMWLSYKEAQKLSGLSRGTLWKLCASGHVQAAKVGKRVLISRLSLEDYLRSRSYSDAIRRYDSY
jgi:excisionase family DNA binding protein